MERFERFDDRKLDSLRARYRGDDLFRTWARPLCQLENQLGELNAVEVWSETEMLRQRLADIIENKEQDVDQHEGDEVRQQHHAQLPRGQPRRQRPQCFRFVSHCAAEKQQRQRPHGAVEQIGCAAAQMEQFPAQQRPPQRGTAGQPRPRPFHGPAPGRHQGQIRPGKRPAQRRAEQHDANGQHQQRKRFPAGGTSQKAPRTR